MKPLEKLRILISGKGGSGKSSIIILLARELESMSYKVILLDGDASNPGGLCRLFSGNKNYPLSLLEYFGGREHVICPSDDPRPLTRINNKDPITENHLQISEIPNQYYLHHGNLILFRVGKINKANEGCDGPMSKITRDFMLDGEYVILLDIEAGIEHFGRGVEQNVDIVLIIVNGTYESLDIAEKITRFCRIFHIDNAWAIINNIESKKDEKFITDELIKRGVRILGTVRHDKEIQISGMKGTALNECSSRQDIFKIIHNLENIRTLKESHY